ncbi:MAG: acetylornithine transaminase [Deltaproteobacteria bacterium]|nr:MAG: acetylornithine transaminase [Deltaproteobacteria bacterium]
MTEMEMADKYIFQTYKRYPIVLVKGEGCRVWDKDGREYLDFVGGIAVCALGHSSPVVTEALENQAKRLVHVSNLFYTIPQIELARFLVEHSFADRVFFCNSGAEANEAAIKLARRYANERFGAKRNIIISMEGSFHGRTMATLSATGQKKIQNGFDPLLQGFRFVPFNDIGALEKALDESVCAVLLEPIQGEGGVICPDPDYLKEVRRLCDEKDVIMILDEVQVGCGRTGRLFAHEHYGIEPDIMTLAKAMANGLPIGAMLSTERLAPYFGPGTHASTFGGTPLVTAVSLAVLKSIIEDGWLENCRDVGRYFKEGLKELEGRYGFIKEVRGKGLILGMELDMPGAEIVTRCMDMGFIINCVQDNVLRFLPPLIVQRNEIDRLLTILDKIFKEI